MRLSKTCELGCLVIAMCLSSYASGQEQQSNRATKFKHSHEFDHVDPSYANAFGSEDADVKGAGTLIEVNHATDEQLAAYDKWFKENEERHLQELSGLVAIPTLAMDPKRGPDLLEAAEVLKKKLSDIGMKQAAVHPADGLLHSDVAELLLQNLGSL